MVTSEKHCKERYGTSHLINRMTDTAGSAFSHVNIPYISHHTILNLIKNIKETYARWFIALGMTVCGDLREKGGTATNVIVTEHPMYHQDDWHSSKASSHVNILYTLFHSLLIQNFDSTRFKKIMDILRMNNLDVSKIICRSDDGARNMSGSEQGLQTLMQKACPIFT